MANPITGAGDAMDRDFLLSAENTSAVERTRKRAHKILDGTVQNAGQRAMREQNSIVPDPDGEDRAFSEETRAFMEKFCAAYLAAKNYREPMDQ